MGVLTPNRTLTEWRLVFFISCGFLILTNLIYIIWASAKTQPWNIPGSVADVNKTVDNGTTVEVDGDTLARSKEDIRL